MKKKIILLSVTFIIIFAGLFVYQRFSNVGPSQSERKPEPIPIPHDRSLSDTDMRIVEISQGIGVGKHENLVHVTTNKKGRIIRKFSYAEIMESLPGQLKFKQLWFQVFSTDDRITEIIAQTGTVEIEGDERQIQFPRSGFLEDVEITMYRLPKDIAPVPGPLSREIPDGGIVEMTVQLSGVVHFEHEVSQLRSEGECVVESEWFTVLGTGLSLTFDQNNERLQELKLKQPKQLRLTRKTMKSRQNRTGSSSASVSKKKTDSTQDKAATYRFTLSENVIVKKSAKNETLLAENIEVIADFDPKQYGSNSPVETIETKDQDPSPDPRDRDIETEAKEDFYITCDGSLEIAFAPEYEPTPLADRLLFKATGKPAQIWKDGKLTSEADTIEYDQTNQCSRLSAGPDRPVRMALSDQQWAIAQRNVTLDQNQNQGRLLGPGCIKLRVAPKAPEDPNAIIFYEDELLVKFTDLAGSLAETKSDESAYVESITFKGPMRAQSKDGYVQAQEKGKLHFFIPPTKPKTSTNKTELEFDVGVGPIQSIELWGDVIARDNQSDIRVADHLEAAFDYIDPNSSRVRSVHAFGPVRAEDPNYIIEAKDKLLLTFADNIVRENPSTLGFDQLLTNSNLLSVIAEGADGNLRFTSKQGKYQVIGDRVVGDESNQNWTITGRPARVIGLAGQGRLRGNQITADLANQTCHVVEQGEMDTVLKGDLFGENIDRPMRMHIDWKNGVTYNLEDGTITVNDADARIESTEGAKQITWLHCPRMTITSDPDSSPARSGELFAKLNLESFRAHGGQVRLRREEYDPITHKRQNEMELNAQQLRYDNRTRITLADGPGAVESINYRFNPSNKDAPKNPSVNQALSRMFGSTGPTYTFLQFGRQMRFDKDPNELQFSGGVALDHLPLILDRIPDPEPLAHLPGRRTLDCNDLILILADANTETGNKQSDVTSGFQQALGAVHRMTALGRVFIEANFDDGTQRSFAGEKLTYDNHTGEIVIVGSDTMPAYLDQMQFRMVIWNLETNHIQGIPLGQSVLSGAF